MSISRVYINGYESISCAGNSSTELFDNICRGKSGIAVDESYLKGFAPAIGKIDSLNSFDENLVLQCKTLLKNSTLDSFKDTLLIIGSSVGGMDTTEKIYFRDKNYKNIDPKVHNMGTISVVLKREFEFYDSISFSTACTSSANAIGYGYEVLSKGIYKNVLVVGVDSLSRTTVGGFLALGVLSSQPCRPFDRKRDGMNVAEGIGCLLLQAEKKDENSVEVCGVGYSSDAYHMTHPHQEGLGAQNAMKNALQSAKLLPEQVDYINAHGTGTVANDSSEAKAIKAIFGNKPYVSSTKSITGHTLGAAGALEAIISCKVLQKQTIPASTNLDEPEEDGVNFSLETKEAKVSYVLSNSFAFGGNNSSLIFGIEI